MIITLNGQSITYAAAPDLHALLEAQGYAGKTVAVARNGTFVPKAQYERTPITDGDAIEIVAPMQGG